MKKFLKSAIKRSLCRRQTLFIIAAVLFSPAIYSQQMVTGKLIGEKSNEAIPYANIVLTAVSDSTMAGGTCANGDGVFRITAVPAGKYKLMATSVGYKPTTIRLDVESNNASDAGTIFLQETVVVLDETVVTGERLKAKSENGKTTFFITKKMLDVSNTGTDILRLIPGIQIDIMQNISIQGSADIAIFVDGKERDKSFLNQLNPTQIDRIEVITTPPSNYDGHATGGINIILKEDKDSGFAGRINAEIPTSLSQTYVFPAYNFSYGFKIINFHTSYHAEVLNFDVHENTLYVIRDHAAETGISSDQYIKQRDWSHRFHYGFDYFIDSLDRFSFYAFCSPSSSEHSGLTEAALTGSNNEQWRAKKEDKNLNISILYSLFYKHLFDEKGCELSLEINYYKLNSKDRTNYIYEGTENNTDTIQNLTKPVQQSTNIKIDFTTLIGEKITFSTGAKAKFQLLQDRNSPVFNYKENVLAAYGILAFKQTKYDIQAGIRAESAVTALKTNFRLATFSLLPNFSFKYKLSSRQNIQFSCNRTINRPNLYQLNPSTSVSNLFMVSKGNPALKPEIRSSLFVEHSIQFAANYFAWRLFYFRSNQVRNNLTILKESNIFETQVQNLGAIHQVGLQFLGSFKLGPATFNPHLRLFNMHTVGNALAKQYEIGNRLDFVYESGLSTILSFRKDIALSFNFQHAKPRNKIQDNSFCDALYFLSLDKTWKQKLKTGIVSGLPFTRYFVYNGSDVTGPGFEGHYRGTIDLSKAFVWFKLDYQFSSGKKRNNIKHSMEEIENMPRKGF